MNQRVLIAAGVAVALALFALLDSLFTVYQSQQALVTQFGNPVRVVREPGLRMKVPFVQSVEFYDKRVLDYEAPSVELVLGDQRRIVVDAFARYRIADPLRFRQGAGNEVAFRAQLAPIVFSALRSVLGEASLVTVLSPDRRGLMNRIQVEANRALDRFGVEVVDVRIKRADLPEENSQAVYRRMQTEREREARELRAQGAEIGQRVRSRADRERRVIIAEAERQSQVTRGEGDARAIDVFGQAFGRDQEFFAFYRSMQAYREALTDDSTSLVLSPEGDFFRFFNQLDLRGPEETPPGGGDGRDPAGAPPPPADPSPQGADAGAPPAGSGDGLAQAPGQAGPPSDP